jgi:uncharacterized repeat protein (TIGR01451 family)
MTAGSGASTLTLIDIVLRNNQASDSGGGLDGEHCNIFLRNVAIVGNKAGSGGGIQFSHRYGVEKLVMTNVTISDNEAQTSGGGLYADYAWGVGSNVTATHVTFAHNRAVEGSGGNIYNKQSTVSLRSTIVAGGTAGGAANNCDGDFGSNITSLGYNLDSGLTCGLQLLGKPGDLWSQNPALDPLGNYGGGTLTHRLQAGSPALNHIPGANGCGASVATDQRGVPRPQPAGGQCDIGAFELGYPILFIDKTATPDTDVAYRGLLTYTIVLDNSGYGHGQSVVLSDTLPSEVDFVDWVHRPAGADVDSDELTWTGMVEARRSISFTFVVSHTGDYGDVVTNTAEYESPTDNGMDEATFTVESEPEAPRSYVFLPIVLRDAQP